MSRSRLHRSAILVDELKTANLEEYQTVILSFINCLILGTEEIWERHSIRSEMIAIGLLDVIETMRTKAEQATEPKEGLDPHLLIQIHVFEFHRSKDEELLDVTDEKPLYDLFTLYFQKV